MSVKPCEIPTCTEIRRMGEEGREHVRRTFLITRNLRDLLVLVSLTRERL